MKLSDIARLAGVSVTTASYVINGKAAQRRISAATVERVLAVVEEHGYQPDQQAAGLRRGQTRTLGFILPDLENPSYARLAKQLEQGARARGYQLLIACSDDEPETERQVVNLFRARRCDALIVLGAPNSCNSVRLVEVALDAGAKAAHLIDYASEVDEKWLDGVQTIGVTSGASVPDVLVLELLDWLSQRGWSDVDEITTASEKISFALPRELRDAKQRSQVR